MRVLLCYEKLDENTLKSFLRSFQNCQDLNLIIFKLTNFYNQNNLDTILDEEDKLSEQIEKADIILFECSKSKKTFPILYKQIVKHERPLLLLTHSKGETNKVISEEPSIKQVRYLKKDVSVTMSKVISVLQ